VAARRGRLRPPAAPAAAPAHLQRLVSLGEAAVAGALAFSSFKVASGKASKSKGQQAAFVGKVFDLLLVAAGLACFGAYCLFDARYRRG
jgi:hypothetical protein